MMLPIRPSLSKPLVSSTRLLTPNMRPSPCIGLSFEALGIKPFTEKPMPPTKNAPANASNIVTKKIGEAIVRQRINNSKKYAPTCPESLITEASKTNAVCSAESRLPAMSSPTNRNIAATAIINRATLRSCERAN